MPAGGSLRGGKKAVFYLGGLFSARCGVDGTGGGGGVVRDFPRSYRDQPAASRPMRNPRRTMVSAIDVSSAPFIAGPPLSPGLFTPCGPGPLPPSKKKTPSRATLRLRRRQKYLIRRRKRRRRAVVMNPRCHLTTTSGGACYSPFLWVICATTRWVAWGVRFSPYPTAFVKPKLRFSHGRSRGKSEP